MKSALNGSIKSKSVKISFLRKTLQLVVAVLFLLFLIEHDFSRGRELARLSKSDGQPEIFHLDHNDALENASSYTFQQTKSQNVGPMGESIFPPVPHFGQFEQRQKWCAVIYGGDDVTIFKVPASPIYPSFYMALYKTGDVVSKIIRGNGQWEEKLTYDMFRVFGSKSLFAGKTFIDIGANVGWYTLTALSKGITVLAFEPDQKNRRLIEYSVCLNEGFGERLTMYSMGLAEHNQTCYLVSLVNNVGDTNTVCNKEQQDELYSLGGDYTVRDVAQFTSLDNILAANENIASQSFSVMKIDIEGHEHIALSEKASKNFFANHTTRPPVVFSELFRCMHDHCEEDRPFVEMMMRRGYVMWRVLDITKFQAPEGWNNVFTNFDDFLTQGSVTNVVFVDRDRVTPKLQYRN